MQKAITVPEILSRQQDKGTDYHTLKQEIPLNLGGLILKPGGVRAAITEEQKLLINDNEFPVHVLPGLFKEVVNELHSSLNFPPAYTATALLIGVSTAIGKTAGLKVKGTWLEYPTLFGAIVGGPGANKSHPMQTPFEIYGEIDYLAACKFEREFEIYNDFMSLSKKEKTERQAPDKPKLFKTVLHNATPESLGQRVADNPRGCVFVSDELATLLEGMNNYSKGDQTSTFLSIWSGKSTSIDRVSKPVPLFIRDPFLNIIGTVQPRVIPKLFPSNKTDNGFFQRFLWAYPHSAEKMPINDIDMDESVLERYNHFITDYINDNPAYQHPETGKNEPRIYNWTQEAKTFFYAWSQKNATLVNENAESLKGEVISKFDIHFVRLSLILEIMLKGQKDDKDKKTLGQHDFTISLDSVKAAEVLCDYYQKCAFKVLDLLTKGPIEEVLPNNKSQLYNALPERFTTSEANIIGDPIGFNVKAVQRFLTDTDLFKKESHGNYSKIIKT